MNLDKPVNLSEEMQLFLEEAGFLREFAALSRQLLSLQPSNPVHFLYETAVFRAKASKIFELYSLLRALCEKTHDFLEIHRVLCDFFVFKGNSRELSRKNLEKLYKLLLFEFPEKLVSMIIEVHSCENSQFLAVFRKKSGRMSFCAII